MSTSKYILTLSCPDQMGVVHTVSGFLFERGGNIIDSAQFNDTDSDRFFMRVNFEERRSDIDLVTLKTEFAPIAERFDMDWQLVDEAAKPRLMIMVSKIGHCLNDLLFRHKSGNLPVDIAAIVSNHPDFYQLAASYNIPFHHFPLLGGGAEQKPNKNAVCWKYFISKTSTLSCWRVICKFYPMTCVRPSMAARSIFTTPFTEL